MPKEVNDKDLENVSGGKSFGTKTCPNCGKEVSIIYETINTFTKIYAGMCTCGHDFRN